MSIRIEKKYYGPESTREECEALKERVYFYKDNIIMFKEVPVQSNFQLDIFWEKINEITKGKDKFYLIIDLTEASPPSAKIRKYLKKKFSDSINKLPHVSVFTESNFMLNVAAKFVLSGIGFSSYSVHKTLEEALKEIHGKKQV